MNLLGMFGYGVLNNRDLFLILDDYQEVYHNQFEVRRYETNRLPLFFVGAELEDEIYN